MKGEIFIHLGLPRRGRVYLLGAGGIGVSSLAWWFLAQKWAVEGSDIAKSPLTSELRKQGIKVKIGPQNRLAIPRRVDLLVYSQAVAGSRFCGEALARGIPAFSYPQFVGRLTRYYRTVAIAGAHGKSTTTALVGIILAAGRLDPTVIVGTKLREFGGRNFRRGKGIHLVLEADEYGRAFLNYSPAVAVVTSIDREHLDTYQNLGDIKRTFLQFLSNTAAHGTLVLNRDDKNLRSLAPRVRKLAARKKLHIVWYSLADADVGAVRRAMKIPGEHNVSNALAAIRAAASVGVPRRIALAAISRYRGSWRRMEYRGTMRIRNYELQITDKDRLNKTVIHNSRFIIPVYDDYAHHPTEIRATLAALKEKYPERKIICVFQPHQTRRLQTLWKEFIGAFNDADVMVLLPLYRVAGRDPSTNSGQATSVKLAEAIHKKYPGKSIHYLANPKNLEKFLSKILSPKPHPLSPILVMMGAGDIVNYTDALVRP